MGTATLGPLLLAVMMVNQVTGAMVKRDVIYKSVDGAEIALDVYVPDVRKYDRAPVFYYIHGGGWWSGDKSDVPGGVFDPLLDAGAVCVSVNYRYAAKGPPEHPVGMRDCAADVKDGLRFLKKNGEAFGLDLSRVVVAGSSAGAHLAMLSALSEPGDFSGDEGLNDFPVKPVACISYSGPVDFTDSDLFVPAGITATLPPDRFTNRVKQGAPRISYAEADEELKAMMREVSPVRYLDKDDPPVLMIHGDRDGVIPLKHAQRLQEEAGKIGADVHVITVIGAGHGFNGQHTPGTEELDRAAVEFVLKQLGLK